MKPILFNTEMVRAILDGRKTTTRRNIKLKYDNTYIKWRTDKYGTQLVEMQNDVEGETHGDNPDGSHWHKLLAYRPINPPYKKGDVLYVRETFNSDWCDHTIYKADGGSAKDAGYAKEPKWHPSLHMPKEAARIFLRVTDVRAERLQEIDKYWSNYDEEGMRNPKIENISIAMQEKFISIWNSTVKKSDLDRYGWGINPWVWVIRFERCDKPNER